MKFVMTQSVCAEGLALLDGVAEVYAADNPDPNNYLDQMQDADALIVRIAKCDGHAIENSPNLKVIGRTGIGYDTIDVAKATSLGIPVVVTPGANQRSVAEHAVAMMLALAKNIVEGNNELRRGNWEIRGAKKAFEVEEKQVGIIGLGPIGRETMKICLGIGMKINAYDPFFTKEEIESLGATWYENLDDLIKISDIVSVHMPLVDATRNLITSRELSLMKKTGLLVNCSRGGIVNEADLIDALQSHQIAGAALDVFCEEPPAPDSALMQCPNLIVSPHSAAQTRESVIKMATMCVSGCLAVCRGEKWPYVVEPKVYDHPRWKNK